MAVVGDEIVGTDFEGSTQNRAVFRVVRYRVP
jgi:hypothetical protein